MKTIDAKFWQKAHSSPQRLVKPKGTGIKKCFPPAPWLLKSVILQDDRLPKLCPINKLLISPCDFCLQDLLCLQLDCVWKTDLTLACPLPRCAVSAPESFLQLDTVNLHDLPFQLSDYAHSPAHTLVMHTYSHIHSVEHTLWMHWLDFFSPDTDSDAQTLSINRHQVLIRYQWHDMRL